MRRGWIAMGQEPPMNLSGMLSVLMVGGLLVVMALVCDDGGGLCMA